MHSILRIFLFTALCATTAIASTPETAKEKATREAKVKARLEEHARKKSAPKPSKSATSISADSGDVTMMDEVIVSNSRITELDVQIKKLDKKIKRAKKKIKPSDLDETMNSDKVPAALLIFGGKTAGQRRSVAAERVNLMEAERDILEAMKYVRTKREQKQLDTQLNAFKSMRLQLDEVLR